MNIDEIEAKIRAAVAEAKAKGWRIIRNAYYVPASSVAPASCCPLGALVIDQIEEASAKAAVPERAATRLSISYREAVLIAQSVDGFSLVPSQAIGERAFAMGALGTRLRDLVDT